MNTFEQNIVNIYGDKGKTWLASLRQRVQEAAAIWGLDHLKPLDNLSHNYVLAGYKQEKPIILKLSLDPLSLRKEIEALIAFAGYGAVKTLEYTKDALLLERAMPGTSLKSNSQNAIKIACDVVKKLHKAPLPREHNFPQITQWLSSLDQDWDIPETLLLKARVLKNQLLQNTQAAPGLLHGDLHQDNILANGNQWLIIDPKGVIGYPINEVWALVEDPAHDLRYISNYFDFSFDDVVKWYYVHVALAACWRVEDHLDPKLFLDLAHTAQSMIKL